MQTRDNGRYLQSGAPQRPAIRAGLSALTDAGMPRTNTLARKQTDGHVDSDAMEVADKGAAPAGSLDWRFQLECKTKVLPVFIDGGCRVNFIKTVPMW